MPTPQTLRLLWPCRVAGLSTPSDFVRMTSTAAAQIYNVYPRKGRVAAGSDADVILLDPRPTHTLGVGQHHSRMDTNVYEGKAVQVGRPACGPCFPDEGRTALRMTLCSACAVEA
jgi:dihydroorotase-like cyclic amidohydrolase